ncbi:MAG: hypothetical protein GY795_31995 [Desulfobacterales bacterium]|nr:hypothetical protein [Desulfobacterales bacterium]
MSLRVFLWEKFCASEVFMAMPNTPTSKEIMISIFVCAFFMGISWWGFKQAFFYVSESARASQRASVAFGLFISFAWLFGALEWAGWESTRWMVVIMLCTTIFTITYLVWVKKK